MSTWFFSSYEEKHKKKVAQANWRNWRKKFLFVFCFFNVNFNNYSIVIIALVPRYFLYNYYRHLNGKYHSYDGGGDCHYNNGNDQGNSSNSDGKTKLNLYRTL
jgi:hypothetical protein